jgi:hypothetical protein
MPGSPGPPLRDVLGSFLHHPPGHRNDTETIGTPRAIDYVSMVRCTEMCLLTNVTGQNHLKHHLDHNRNQIQTLTIFEIILIFDSAEIRDKSELSANMHMSQM